jgi:hypothetical protein
MKTFEELSPGEKRYVISKIHQKSSNPIWIWEESLCQPLLENGFIEIVNPITKGWSLTEKGWELNRFYNL